jgi:hypothetical protein
MEFDMSNQREHDALKAYLKLLEHKGFPEAKLIQRQYIILRLIPFIEHIPQDGTTYRAAVDKLFNVLDHAEWAICIPVIRDYFSFWVKDIKAIAGMNQDKAFEANPKEWKPETRDLKALWESLDKATLTHYEVKPLETYENALRNRGADDFFIDTRKKIVKLLLLRLRDVPHKQPNAYRKVIDANLPLFTSDETHHTFLNVGREFYYFWKGDQNAAQQLALAA